MADQKLAPQRLADPRRAGARLPITAVSSTSIRPSRADQHGRIRILVVHHGSGVLSRADRSTSLESGTIVILGTAVQWALQPTSEITTTMLSIAPAFLSDQVFWQYEGLLRNRQKAQDLVEMFYAHAVQVLQVSRPTLTVLGQDLHAMVCLSADGQEGQPFFRMLHHWSSVAGILMPHTRIAAALATGTQQSKSVIAGPEGEPIRHEMRTLLDTLHRSLGSDWTLSRMAELVHLSPRQFSRAFLQTYGITPLSYLTMLRAEEMARLLRETKLSIAEIGRRVGWGSRSRATEAFTQHTGMPPQQYRHQHTS